MNDLAPWLHAPLRRALASLGEGRLAHGLLICGPDRIGKHAFAVALTQALLCRQREDDQACGRCRDCVLYLAGTHPDVRAVGITENEKTGVLRKEIVIEQVRDLGAWFALTSQRGGAQVARIEPASAMNTNAANALLKTLEEPLPGRFLLLLCESPMRLPATIRSRCQRIVLQPPDVDTALAWLRARGHDEALARSALLATNGHPGLAAHWIDAGLLDLREVVRNDLTAVAGGHKQALEVAAAWLADDQTAQRLAFAADLAVDLQARTLGVATRGEWKLARTGDAARLGDWFDAANRTRELLRSPIRADLAIAALLRQWRQALAA
ncbi:MAG: DNA polymerase III subunit delta' [Proteobacteria bacterium]|nr:DNA polymerase III subunit delta' [Pseudomonadota bacterium]MBS0463543.1 DNA polymerase III subunit delta' [Pseudomonadota bacterium]